MQSFNLAGNLFTVYQTEFGIELHPGCEDYLNWKAIHTCKSYESAYHFAQTAADHRQLPFKDSVKMQASSSI